MRSRNTCRCTSTSIEPCDYCMSEGCGECGCLECECEDSYDPDLESDNDPDNSQAAREYENWLNNLKNKADRY